VNLPFSSIRIISIVLFIFASMCPEFTMCCAYVNMFLLCRIACVCSAHLCWNERAVWPMYCRGQERHVSLHMPLLFLCWFCCRWVRKMLDILKGIFMCVSSNIFVIFWFLVRNIWTCPSFPGYGRFTFCCAGFLDSYFYIICFLEICQFHCGFLVRCWQTFTTIKMHNMALQYDS
jgi:hypothetical protein